MAFFSRDMQELLDNMTEQIRKVQRERAERRLERRNEANRRQQDEPVAIERRQAERRSGIEDRRAIRYSLAEREQWEREER